MVRNSTDLSTTHQDDTRTALISWAQPKGTGEAAEPCAQNMRTLFPQKSCLKQ